MGTILRCIFFALLLAGCGCALNRTVYQAVDASWDCIGPEYLRYVEDDPILSDEDKAIRKRTAELLTQVLEEAK